MSSSAAAQPLQNQAGYRLLCQALTAAQDAAWQSLDSVGWQNLAVLAEDQGVAPLLFNHLPADAPEAARTRLQRSFYTSAAANALKIQELKNILKALQQDNIPVVALKGIDLAVDLYSDPALRPMTDLDLLVPFPYVRMAVRSLTRLGYRKMNENLAHHHVLLHGGPQEQVAVELHWSLVDPFRPGAKGNSQPQDWFWQHTRPWPGTGTNAAAQSLQELDALALDPAASLLYLTAHLLLQHAGEAGRLVWYYDIFLLLERCSGGDLDWQALLRQAQRLGWEELVAQVLHALEQRFDLSKPAGYLAAQAALVQSGPEQAIHAAQPSDFKGTRTTIVWRGLQAQPLPQRVRLLWDIFFPEPAYLRWRYRPNPQWLWPLYYLYRWFDILRDSIQTLVKPETPR